MTDHFSYTRSLFYDCSELHYRTLILVSWWLLECFDQLFCFTGALNIYNLQGSVVYLSACVKVREFDYNLIIILQRESHTFNRSYLHILAWKHRIIKVGLASYSCNWETLLQLDQWWWNIATLHYEYIIRVEVRCNSGEQNHYINIYLRSSVFDFILVFLLLQWPTLFEPSVARYPSTTIMLSWRSIGLLFIVLHIYLIIGMIAFHFLERDREEEVKTDTKVYKDAILANFTCLSEERLESLIRVIAYAVNNGIDPSNSSSPSNWDWHQTFFFSGTVITTIGKLHHISIVSGCKSSRAYLGQVFSFIWCQWELRYLLLVQFTNSVPIVSYKIR